MIDLLGLDEMLNESGYEQLYEKLHQGRCVLVLGPNLATMQGTKIPIHEALALELAKVLDARKIPYDESQKNKLEYIALRCAYSGLPQLAQDKLKLVLQNAYQKNTAHIPEIYEWIARLPFHLIINTSPDTYPQQAFGSKAQLSYYNYLRNNSQPIGEISFESPLVYNLFGVYNQPESMVVSQADQIEFINRKSDNAAKIPLAILEHLQPDTLYLLLGFHADSWHLPLLFRTLNFHQHSAAFYYEEQSLPQHWEELYRDVFRFDIKYQELLSFVQKLAEGYPDWAAQNQKEEVSPMVYVSRPDRDPQNGKSTVLFMSSNPKDTSHLQLNREINEIKMDELAKAPLREQFALEAALDVNKSTLSVLFGNYRPQIVHFSGHGIDQGLLFYSDVGFSDIVSGEALGKAIRHHPSISCVVLNACYSEAQAQAIARYVPNVIGTNGAIGDEKAIAFGRHFYRAIFQGKDYEAAFRQAIDDLGLFLEFIGGTDFVYYRNGERITD